MADELQKPAAAKSFQQLAGDWLFSCPGNIQLALDSWDFEMSPVSTGLQKVLGNWNGKSRERKRDRRKGEIFKRIRFILGCSKWSKNRTKIRNLKNRERSQQDHQTEESEGNLKFTGIVSFFTSSFLSHPFSYNVETVHGEKNNGWMDCWCIETTEPWTDFLTIRSSFHNQQSNADRESRQKRRIWLVLVL